VTTEIGQVELQVPRDRNASFEPVTVRKGQRRLDGLSGNVISLYAKGMTTGDIQAHLAEIYDTDISRDTISRITDGIVEDLQAWQSRPLVKRRHHTAHSLRRRLTGLRPDFNAACRPYR